MVRYILMIIIIMTITMMLIANYFNSKNILIIQPKN